MGGHDPCLVGIVLPPAGRLPTKTVAFAKRQGKQVRLKMKVGQTGKEAVDE